MTLKAHNLIIISNIYSHCRLYDAFLFQGGISPDGEVDWSPDETTTSWVNMASVSGCENYM